jgi:hypothetical protein
VTPEQVISYFLLVARKKDWSYWFIKMIKNEMYRCLNEFEPEEVEMIGIKWYQELEEAWDRIKEIQEEAEREFLFNKYERANGLGYLDEIESLRKDFPISDEELDEIKRKVDEENDENLT